jgi:pre-mRNA-splicing factor CDC5/CEF1
MVRVFLKGGIWKNSEDEILKAAVQKYGKQQWSRVASLLNRKTAKQAKARWYEWLDPSIRKIDWTTQEEEQLLHLAKLLPAQWKTIGPIIGRTATQCQEHYEYLLDQAALAQSAASSGEAAAAAEGAAGGAASVYRVGQIDSHPETKPARPDPVDMDEDEMEMLQEARARLANTVGKKAKRKQREKILQQAKRLSDLQKRRELKQAGLISTAASEKARKAKKKKSQQQIDLGVEIPFYKPAPIGFHDISNEQLKTTSALKKRLTQINYQTVNEQQFKSRDREIAMAKKREQQRLTILEQSTAKYGGKQPQQTEDNEKEIQLGRPRGILSLPAPTVSDLEYHQKQKSVRFSAMEATSGDGGVTQTLVADYTNRPLPTPMRSPHDGASVSASSSAKGLSKQQRLLEQASQLRQLEQGQTPLLYENYEGTMGEDGEDVEEDDRKPAAQPREGNSATAGTTGVENHFRDEFGLNPGNRSAITRKRPPTDVQSVATSIAGYHSSLHHDDDAASVGASTFASSKYTTGRYGDDDLDNEDQLTSATPAPLSIKEIARRERRAAQRARAALEAALASLPMPQYEYDFVVPATAVTDDDDEDGKKSLLQRDRADAEAEESERLRKEAEKLYHARSSVVKRRDLPRPPTVPARSKNLTGTELQGRDPVAYAHGLIHDEVITLLHHDFHAFPVEAASGGGADAVASKSRAKKRKVTVVEIADDANATPPTIDAIPEDLLDLAKSMMEEEALRAMDEAAGQVIRSNLAASYADAIQVLSKESVSRSLEIAETARPDPNAVTKYAAEFDALVQAAESLRRKNDKVEAKLGVVNGGYIKRAGKVQEGATLSFDELQKLRNDKVTYEMLYEQEVRGAASRMEGLRQELQSIQEEEAAYQKRYGELIIHKRRQEAQQKQNTEGK